MSMIACFALAAVEAGRRPLRGPQRRRSSSARSTAAAATRARATRRLRRALQPRQRGRRPERLTVQYVGARWQATALTGSIGPGRSSRAAASKCVRRSGAPVDARERRISRTRAARSPGSRRGGLTRRVREVAPGCAGRRSSATAMRPTTGADQRRCATRLRRFAAAAVAATRTRMRRTSRETRGAGATWRRRRLRVPAAGSATSQTGSAAVDVDLQSALYPLTEAAERELRQCRRGSTPCRSRARDRRDTKRRLCADRTARRLRRTTCRRSPPSSAAWLCDPNRPGPTTC